MLRNSGTDTHVNREVYDFVRDKINNLSNDAFTLAKIRNGVNMEPGIIPDIREHTVMDASNWDNRENKPTPEDWATYVAITLFAEHSRNRSNVYEEGVTLGMAAGRLRRSNKDNIGYPAVNVFDAVLRAIGIKLLSRYSCNLVGHMRTAGEGLDYPLSATDLLAFQLDKCKPNNKIQTRWMIESITNKTNILID